MRILLCLLLSCLFLTGPSASVKKSSKNSLFVFDFIQKKAHAAIQNFGFAGIPLSLNLNIFPLADKKGNLIPFLYRISLEQIFLNDSVFPNTTIDVVKGKKKVVLRYLHNKYIFGRGEIDLSSNKPVLDLELSFVNFPLSMFALVSGTKDDSGGGTFSGKIKLWGSIENIFGKGNIKVKDGSFEGLQYKKAEFIFEGALPILKLIDSKIFLYDGSVYEIEGFVDVRNIKNLFVTPTDYASTKVGFGKWQFYTKDSNQNIGMIKKIDKHFSLLFDTYINKENTYDEDYNSGMELRYGIGGNKFLKMRLQNNKSVVGFERRSEF